MREGLQWLEMRKCGMCGKDFAVLYPHLWRFKRLEGAQKKYFCSWGCVREFDQKGVEKVEMSEKNRKAVEIALDGGNPIEYLKKEGSKNPSAAWYSIKAQVKEKDPETYAKLPGRIAMKEPEKKKITEPEKQKITKPVNYAGFEMMLVRSMETGYRYEWSQEFDLFTIRAIGDELTLSLEDMRKMYRELPEAAAVLGVEL